MSDTSQLAQAARVARLAAALGLAVLAAYLLVDAGLESAAPELPSAREPVRRLPALPPVDEAEGSEDPKAPAAPAAAASARAQLPPATSRQILVDFGPPRSDVLVDGHRVGQTPFVGQVRCRPGRPIVIQVIPERGLPLEETRVCPQ